MKTHEVKTDPIYFDKMWRRIKISELRFNDRAYKQGDRLLSREYDRKTKKYSDREILFTITYVTSFPEALKDGWVMLCLKVIELGEVF